MNQADQEYIQELAQNILEHSGVKGMKWGHRRAIKKMEKMALDTKSNSRLKSKLAEVTKEQNSVNKTFGKSKSSIVTAAGMRETKRLNDKAELIKGLNSSKTMDAANSAKRLQSKVSGKVSKLNQKLSDAQGKGKTSKAAHLQKKRDAALAYSKMISQHTTGVVNKTRKANAGIQSAINQQIKASKGMKAANKKVNTRASNISDVIDYAKAAKRRKDAHKRAYGG